MDQSSLVSEEIEAGEKLAHEFNKYKRVVALFWLKASDEEYRYLYIASDQVNDTNIREAYTKVLQLANGLQSPYLDPFRVKLLDAKKTLAKAAVDINQKYPGPMAIRFGGNTFGGLSVDDVFIYPPLHTAVP